MGALSNALAVVRFVVAARHVAEVALVSDKEKVVVPDLLVAVSFLGTLTFLEFCDELSTRLVVLLRLVHGSEEAHKLAVNCSQDQ